MKTNKEIAALVLDLFDGGKRWGQGAYAMSETGWSINVENQNATKFCLLGACQRLAYTGKIGWEEYTKFRRKLDASVPTDSIISWNDHSLRTYAAVETLLKGI